MDVDRFLRELPAQFDDFPLSERPRDVRFAEVLEAVPGLAQPNNLALLNVAAQLPRRGRVVRGGRHVPRHEPDRRDARQRRRRSSRSTTGRWATAAASSSTSNLARFGLTGAAIVEGDAFETLRSDALEGRAVGVYYYDNGHEYEQQLDGMRLIEPYLASPALVIVDDTDWERVERAVDDYLEQQPRATEILSLDGKDRGAPQWWEGMRVLRWD